MYKVSFCLEPFSGILHYYNDWLSSRRKVDDKNTVHRECVLRLWCCLLTILHSQNGGFQHYKLLHLVGGETLPLKDRRLYRLTDCVLLWVCVWRLTLFSTACLEIHWILTFSPSRLQWSQRVVVYTAEKSDMCGSVWLSHHIIWMSFYWGRPRSPMRGHYTPSHPHTTPHHTSLHESSICVWDCLWGHDINVT